MTTSEAAKVAFLILSDDRERALPGLVMASRMKQNRGAEVRVLFFGPGVRLAASGAVDEQLAELSAAAVRPAACSANVEHYGLADEISARPIGLVAAGGEVEDFARQGFTVLSF